MDIESMVRKKLFKDSEEIEMAAEELKERLYADLEEVSMRYGRLTATHALGKVRRDFTTRRYINPYPISDEDYEFLVEFTDKTRFRVGDRSPEDMADVFEEQLREMDNDAREDVENIVRDFGDYALYAWVDLLLSDIFVEQRNEYADTIVARLLEEIQ